MSRIPVSLFVAAALATGFALINPVHDTDLFWQIKFGDLMLDRGGPVRTEPFYPDAADRPSIPVSPLAQTWFAAIRRIGGWELVKLLDAVLWASAFAIPAFASYRKYLPNQRGAIALAFLAGAITASKFYMLRPQTFAMLGMGTFLAVMLSDWSVRRKVLVGAIVLAVWQNLHPSAIIGGLVAGILAAMDWLAVWWKGGRKPWAETMFVPLSVAAMFATPAGAEILTVMRENADRVALFGVTEWLPMYDPVNRGVRMPALIGIVAMLLAILIGGKRVELGWIAVAIVLAGLTVWSHRFVVFFGVVAVPVWMQVFPRRSIAASTERSVTFLHAALAVLAVVAAYASLKAGRLPLWNSWFPHDAAAALERESLTGPIFTVNAWGGLLTDRGYPGWRVTHDGRYYARTHDECRWYLSAVRGEIAVEDIERRYHPVAFFLSHGQSGLRQKLFDTGRWRLLFEDDYAVVIVRK